MIKLPREIEYKVGSIRTLTCRLVDNWVCMCVWVGHYSLCVCVSCCICDVWENLRVVLDWRHADSSCQRSRYEDWWRIKDSCQVISGQNISQWRWHWLADYLSSNFKRFSLVGPGLKPGVREWTSGTFYTAACTCQTLDQKCLRSSQVANDRHEPIFFVHLQI